MKINLKSYKLHNNIKFLPKTNIIIINNKNIKIPSNYTYFNSVTKIIINFINKLRYNSLKNFILLEYKNIINYFYIKLKIKGLGFKIRKITKNLYYFFFNQTNIYYFYIPKNTIIKWLKKKIIIIHKNLFILKIILAHIILLKKLGPYRLRGIKYPRQIILIKRKKKNY